MDCGEIKVKLTNCLKQHDIGFDQKYLDLSVKKRMGDVKAFRIDPKILEKCDYKQFANCLEEKYSIGKMNEKLLYEFYQNKYIKMKAEEERKAIMNNLVITGRDDDKKRQK